MLFSFNSTSHAIRAERVLLDENLKVTILPLPPKIKAGCGICLLTADKDKAIGILKMHDIEFKTHEVNND